MKLSIIIPAWNEEKTLGLIVEKLANVKFQENLEQEIIIINDGSKDNTWGVMQELSKKNKELKILNNEKNIGKTRTVKRGLIESRGEYVVIQDADSEYEPNEIPELLNLLLEENLDVVYGNRFGRKNKVIYWQNYWGNKLLSTLSNIFTYPRIHVWIPDMEVCYKLMRGDVARQIAPKISTKSKFGLEPEITARLSRYKLNGKHLKFGIVPISYYPRSVKEGKKMKAFQDGFKALKEILIYNLN